MVEHDGYLDDLFGALADPTRRAMLRCLASRPASIGELAAPFDMSFAAASKHVKVLERAGLVRRTVHGRTHVCALEARPLHAGMEWLRHYERFWNERLDVLEQLIAEEAQADGQNQDGKRMSATQSNQKEKKP